jgi:hypothetical protein
MADLSSLNESATRSVSVRARRGNRAGIGVESDGQRPAIDLGWQRLLRFHRLALLRMRSGDHTARVSFTARDRSVGEVSEPGSGVAKA